MKSLSSGMRGPRRAAEHLGPHGSTRPWSRRGPTKNGLRDGVAAALGRAQASRRGTGLGPFSIEDIMQQKPGPVEPGRSSRGGCHSVGLGSDQPTPRLVTHFPQPDGAPMGVRA